MSDLGTVFPPRDEWDIAAYEPLRDAFIQISRRPN